MRVAGERVVVTGGAGFIGSHVVDRLLAAGSDVVVLDDLSVGRRENLAAAGDAELIVGDVRDPGALDQALAGANAVVHMACDNLRASLGRPMHTHDVNATGTLATALAAVRHEVRRFVYVSSSEAYGSAKRTPMDEDHPLDPTTVYGASKAAGELYTLGCMHTYRLEAAIARPFNAYGPREHSEGTSAEVIPKFVTRIRDGKPPVIFGDGSQTRDFTWVEETAAGIVAVLESDDVLGTAVNIAHGRPVSVAEIASHLIEIIGADGLEPTFDTPRPGDVETHHGDTTRAREVLGFEAQVPIREGLERYVAWVDAEGGPAAAGDRSVVRNW